MKTRTLAITAALLVATLANTGCPLNALAYSTMQRRCGQAVTACEDFVAAACERAEACGTRSYEDCVDAFIEEGYDCARAFDVDGDVDECLDSIEDLQCDELGEGAEGCRGTEFLFDDEECPYT